MARHLSLALVVVICIVTAAQPAAAYIDPGSTSMLVQFIVGGIAAGLVLSRRLVRGAVDRVTGLLRSASPDPSDPASSRRSDR
jgi:hypothetical protein